MSENPSLAQAIERSVKQLEESTHELSNWVGLTMNHLWLASERAAPAESLSERVEVAAGLAVRAVESLERLMWEVEQLRASLILHAGQKRRKSPADGT